MRHVDPIAQAVIDHLEAENAQLRSQIATVEKLHREHEPQLSGVGYCHEDSWDWPCPTIRALKVPTIRALKVEP
jgi:hypothetical protein